ncbi:amino acid permease [Actinospongicola halichondriae]|uniref:amino acid permease n=1 Tax=Actinospongicola halichondriae TaxID=3236844 RepID=UPI003D5367D9
MSETPPLGLRRSLGLVEVTASGVGLIIGAGIYVLLAAATAEAGAAVWIAFLVAGGLSALTALSYAELASMYPSAGAEYEYTRRVAPPWVAFAIGWLMILALAVAAAAVSLGFGSYLRYFVDVPAQAGAGVLLVGVTAVAMGGIESSARLTTVLSAVQILGLVVIIAIGVPHVGDESLVDGGTVGGVLGASALVFFAFVGFDEVITLSEETTQPTRTIPRALLLALGVSTLLYVGVAIAGISVLGPDLLAAAEQPLADVMSTAVGGVSGEVVAVVAMIATTNTTLLAITAASRLQFGMASTGALPAALGRVNRRRAPGRAIGLVVAAAACFVLVGDISVVAGVTDFSVYVVFIAVNATVITLRFWQPNRRRPFRVPATVGRVPIPPVLALGVTAVMVPFLDPVAIGLGTVATLIGIAVYVALERLRPPAPRAPRGSDDPNMAPRTTITADDAAATATVLQIDFDVVEFELEEFRAGMQIELQHGRGDPDTNITDDDLLTTGKIALAHLNEIPDYYTRLAVMTRAARRHQADS